VTRLNETTVALEPLETQDLEELHALVEEHVAHTRSTHGRSLLATWSRRRFVKVMPHEWRKVLQLRRVS
jgi:glutamate synthase domain-containing protein 3